VLLAVRFQKLDEPVDTKSEVVPVRLEEIRELVVVSWFVPNDLASVSVSVDNVSAC